MMNWLTTVTNILGFIAVLAGLLHTAVVWYQTYKKTAKTATPVVPRGWRAWFPHLMASLLAAGILLAIEPILDHLNPPLPQVQIQIVDPTSDTSIPRANMKRNTDGYLLYTVKGKITGTLPQDWHIYVLIQESGGDVWWVAGGALQRQHLTAGGVWGQPYATFGRPDSAIDRFLICAIVTRENYKSGDHLPALPGDAIESDTVSVVLAK